MTDEVKPLSDDEVAEIAAMFPHAEYQPTLSPDEVDPCEFCKGTIDDHKANCVVSHVHALCQTVRALRTQLDDTAQLAAKAGATVTKYSEENTALREQLVEAQEKDASRVDDIGVLQARLAQVTQERDCAKEDLRILMQGKFT